MNQPELDTAEDRELEELLVGAFDAPPVPRSLLKRLDKVVEQEWGASPRLADSAAAKLHRGFLSGSRWVRGLLIALALILFAVGLTVRNHSSTAYA